MVNSSQNVGVKGVGRFRFNTRLSGTTYGLIGQAGQEQAEGAELMNAWHQILRFYGGRLLDYVSSILLSLSKVAMEGEKERIHTSGK
jgi:hypothetical protein